VSVVVVSAGMLEAGTRGCIVFSFMIADETGVVVSGPMRSSPDNSSELSILTSGIAGSLYLVLAGVVTTEL